MSYLEDIFVANIRKQDVKVVFELGSRDLVDAIKLQRYYNSKVIAFECNPDCLMECYNRMNSLDDSIKQNIQLVNKAVCLDDTYTSFYPFDLTKYDNMGSSSMLKIDFSQRDRSDPDFNRENPQKEIVVEGTRLDTYMHKNGISNIDVLCIDLQGYELNALKSLGSELHKVKYIITECSIKSTYVNGASYEELHEYLSRFNFRYVCSNRFGYEQPNLNITGFSEFDALFINTSLV